MELTKKLQTLSVQRYVSSKYEAKFDPKISMMQINHQKFIEKLFRRDVVYLHTLFNILFIILTFNRYRNNLVLCFDWFSNRFELLMVCPKRRKENFFYWMEFYWSRISIRGQKIPGIRPLIDFFFLKEKTFARFRFAQISHNYYC